MKGIKRALISLSHREGLHPLVVGLSSLGVEIISTGGTAKAITQLGFTVTPVEEVTHFPEILGGRVKTLHPKIHGAILGDPSQGEHQRELEKHGIIPIGLVVVNLYPFSQKIKEKGISLEEAIESIDIGGPTLIRGAAKNWQNVAVVTDPHDYGTLLQEMKEKGEVGEEMRLSLAQKAFAHTASYDSIISQYFWEEGLGQQDFPLVLNLSYSRIRELRYGENPHQRAAFYGLQGASGSSLLKAKQLHGKGLSYNNLNDAASALNMVMEFDDPAAVVVKHTNPCGAALGKDLLEAFKRAYGGDPFSAFGGIVALNKRVQGDCALELTAPGKFLEVVIAPSYSEEALDLLKGRWKDIRLLALPHMEKGGGEGKMEIHSLPGGALLVQDSDDEGESKERWQVVSKRGPSTEEMEDLAFAYYLAKHVKSNAITVVKDRTLIGVGAGQMSRVDAMGIALRKASQRGGVVGSDAFFPKLDAIEEAGKAGITAIIQPGGSVADKQVIKAVNQQEMAMIFTGKRHFRH